MMKLLPRLVMRLLPALLGLVLLLAAAPVFAAGDDAFAPPAEPAAVPDTSEYQRIPMDINGYENYTLGTALDSYFTPEEMTTYKSTDSDGVFNFYDIKMVDETANIEYYIAIGSYFDNGVEIVGSVEMHMDAGFGDSTFYHIKKQLEDTGAITLTTTSDDKVEGGLHINMEDEQGDTFELAWIPVNTVGKNSGTSVFVSSIDYFLALIDSMVTEQAPPAEMPQQ